MKQAHRQPECDLPSKNFCEYFLITRRNFFVYSRWNLAILIFSSPLRMFRNGHPKCSFRTSSTRDIPVTFILLYSVAETQPTFGAHCQSNYVG